MADTTELLRREIRVLLFDLYGTVVDMQGGLEAVSAPFLAAKGAQVSPRAFVTWWRRTHFEDSMIDALLARGHTPYRQIGHRAVSQVLERAGIAHSQAEVEALVAEITRLKPFPDVVAALERLRRRYRLAVLSNGDRDMLEAARPHIGIAFEQLISVQEAGFFKPHFATYATAERLLGAAAGEIERSGVLFVANHPFDLVGAKAHGFRTAFINRRRRPFGQSPYQPDLVVPDMRSLAEALA